MDIKTIGVVGAGQMGAGIAQVAAHSGFQVVMSDVADSFVQKGLAAISKSLSRMVEKGFKEPSNWTGWLMRDWSSRRLLRTNF
jgi:3-hydroxybutyryl-CoA dehydrogenase